MKEFFNGNGVLTKDGIDLLLEFNTALDNLLASDEVHDMSESEIRTLGSVLAKILGDRISNRIASKIQTISQFDKMTDKEFEEHLINRYGNNWTMLTLSPEEFARLPTVDFDQLIKDMRAVGESIIKHLNCNGVRLK
jgi:hypothetical protein